MLRDSDIEKWQAREHTRVKHELLSKYLGAWIPVLSSAHERIGYFDGFAGRGEYEDGSLGSPILAMQVADKLASHYERMVFFFVEKDNANFQNLEDVLNRETPKLLHKEKMIVIKRHGEFADITDELFNELGSRGNRLVPSFFFIDPFGFGGVPFAVIKRILTNERTEVFLNLMIRDINRFLILPELAPTLTELFGTEEWIELAAASRREIELVDFYRRQLHDNANARYSLHFRVCESDRSSTLYYLIHATNHFKGHDIMKSIMSQQGIQGTFCYLGPDDRAERSQLRLFDVNDPAQLREFLLRRFSGRTLAFDDIREQSCHPWYEEPPHIEKHYREVIKQLEEDGAVHIRRISSKKFGLKERDEVSFSKS
jgi:three-Cys-motif partner protein